VVALAMPNKVKLLAINKGKGPGWRGAGCHESHESAPVLRSAASRVSLFMNRIDRDSSLSIGLQSIPASVT
jgi:hypothetical protein